jgi:hypothetical protein
MTTESEAGHCEVCGQWSKKTMCGSSYIICEDCEPFFNKDLMLKGVKFYLHTTQEMAKFAKAIFAMEEGMRSKEETFRDRIDQLESELVSLRNKSGDRGPRGE